VTTKAAWKPQGGLKHFQAAAKGGSANSGDIWVPPVAARPSLVKALVNIIGVSGVGKSFLMSQLLDDPDYGPEEVFALMHEDATAAYGPKMLPSRIGQATTPDEADKIVNQLIWAHKHGKRLPKVILWDSVTGMTDYFQTDKEVNPNMVWNKETSDFVRDKRSEYGDMGRWAQRLYIKLRDQIPSDVICLITSYEDRFSPMPEIACEGKIIPKNITRWSSCTLYMKAVEGKASPEEVAQEIATGPKPYRSYGYDAAGALTGTFISRFFVAQNTGEIQAKGHRNLGLTERAILPDVLRKLRGIGVTTPHVKEKE